MTQTAEWKELTAQQQRLAQIRLSSLFAEDPGRFDNYSLPFNDLLFDFSKHFIDQESLTALIKLAESRKVRQAIASLMSGENVNVTESRPALHTALRADARTAPDRIVDSYLPQVGKVRERIDQISTDIRGGAWTGSSGKTIDRVVNLGVGGSDLGPRTVSEALVRISGSAVKLDFVASTDGNELIEVLAKSDPETTLFIVASKSFDTSDTLSNARSAKRWLQNALGEQVDLSAHFIGVSANAEAMAAFGIPETQQLPLWDWVGGRYSLWSAIGLSIAISVGIEAFDELLFGARLADEHFATEPLDGNIPVIMALLSIWYSNFFKAPSQLILPYDFRLRHLPDYLQQLEMESNGKSTTLDALPVGYSTAPILWGAFGPNAQHAFYQLLHQGTHFVPADFIAVCENPAVSQEQQRLALANCFAQSRALMEGQQIDVEDSLSQHRYYPGNKPSTTILLKRLDPMSLGALIAFYEHKVYVQSVIWNINAFDQWGVELGKKLANELLGAKTDSIADSSTLGLMAFSGL